MLSYGQFCPLAQSTQLLCERWTLLVVRELIAGSTRFSELQRGLPLISPTMLSRRLKTLERAGVIQTSVEQGHSVYELSEAGRELRPIVELLGAWGHRWARSDLSEGDLDAGLLMWDMRRSIKPDVFRNRQVVVEFEYPDAPKGARNWWLVAREGDIDLCLHDPGHEVDLLVRSSLRAMTRVWICEQTLNAAIRSGEIRVLGNPELARGLQDWLTASPLSKLGTRPPPEVVWKSTDQA